MSTTTEHELRAALDKAESALAEIKRERAAEERAATLKVRSDFAEKVDAATEAAVEARANLHDYIDQSATHPWEGKRVCKTQPVRVASIWNRTDAKETIHGVVEVRRSDTKFPQNATWNLPSRGEAFVRLEKANGKPGLRLERTWKGVSEDGWSLVEDDA